MEADMRKRKQNGIVHGKTFCSIYLKVFALSKNVENLESSTTVLYELVTAQKGDK